MDFYNAWHYSIDENYEFRSTEVLPNTCHQLVPWASKSVLVAQSKQLSRASLALFTHRV